MNPARRSDHAFGLLLVVSALAVSVLLLPVAITLAAGPSYRAIALSGVTLVLAAGLALGQATRAHLIPEGGLPEVAPAAHQCPMPYDVPLL